MTVAQIVMLTYAALLLVGGFLGFRAGSKPSLIAGVASGLAMLLALYVSQTNPRAGLWAGAVISLLLAVVFGRRLASTGKFMPAGLLLITSIVSLVVVGASALGVW